MGSGWEGRTAAQHTCIYSWHSNALNSSRGRELLRKQLYTIGGAHGLRIKAGKETIYFYYSLQHLCTFSIAFPGCLYRKIHGRLGLIIEVAESVFIRNSFQNIGRINIINIEK